jgi:hypothetical protein
MLSTIVDNNDTQKLLSFGASFSAFIVGLFAMSKYTVEHRRTGFLIEKALDAWLVGNGEFSGLTKTDAFRELVNQIQIILDTNETSFVGSGSVPLNLFDQDEPTEGPTIASDDPLFEYADVFQDAPNNLRTRPIAAMGVERIEAVIPEHELDTVTYSAAIDPQDFPAWQAEQLAATEYDEITQG